MDNQIVITETSDVSIVDEFNGIDVLVLAGENTLAAATSASEAATSATNAAASATAAANSATAANTSKNAAASSATDAATSASAANTSKNAAASSATAAATSATNAGNSATAAAGSASAASTSATNAGNSATAAAGSASAASTSATNAAGSASGAANSATAAAAAQGLAEDAADAAAHSLSDLTSNLPNFSYAVETLNPGDNATLLATGAYPDIQLAFGVPPGADAAQPNFSFSVQTLAPGSNASLTVTGTYPNLELAFGVPRGDTGSVTGVSFGVITGSPDDNAALAAALGGKSAVGHKHPLADINATGTASASTYLRGDGTWTAPPAGTVTSVALSAPTGLSVANSPVTSSGTLALSYASGYQGYTTTEATKLSGIASGATANAGTVTSVALSGGTTGLTVSGSPITTSGTITIAGTLAVANGGTGATTAANARTNLGLGTAATMAGPSGAIVGTTDTQTFTNKTHQGYTETVVATVTGSALSPNLANGTIFPLITNAAATITLPTPAAGKSFVVPVQYGGAHGITWAGGPRKWPAGTAPTPTSVNGKIDIFTFICVDGSNWLAFVSGQDL